MAKRCEQCDVTRNYLDGQRRRLREGKIDQATYDAGVSIGHDHKHAWIEYDAKAEYAEYKRQETLEREHQAHLEAIGFEVAYLHRFDRSGADRVYCVTFRGPNGEELEKGREVTILEEIREAMARHKSVGFRNDIVLLHRRVKRNETQQYEVHPYDDGVPRGSAWEFLSPRDQEWCREINAAMVEEAKRIPEMAVMLSPSKYYGGTPVVEAPSGALKYAFGM